MKSLIYFYNCMLKHITKIKFVQIYQIKFYIRNTQNITNQKSEQQQKLKFTKLKESCFIQKIISLK